MNHAKAQIRCQAISPATTPASVDGFPPPPQFSKEFTTELETNPPLSASHLTLLRLGQDIPQPSPAHHCGPRLHQRGRNKEPRGETCPEPFQKWMNTDTALLAGCAKKKKKKEKIKLLVKQLFPSWTVSHIDPVAHQQRFLDTEHGAGASAALPSSYRVSHPALKPGRAACPPQQAATGRITDLPENRWRKGEKRVTGLLTPRPLWRIAPA